MLIEDSIQNSLVELPSRTGWLVAGLFHVRKNWSSFSDYFSLWTNWMSHTSHDAHGLG